MQTNEKIDALKTTSEYIDSLKEIIITASEYFQMCEEGKGSELIPQIVEGIQWINEVIILTKDIQTKKIVFDDMDKEFKKIINAFENEDFILIGDLLQYEIIKVLNNIQEKINSNIKN